MDIEYKRATGPRRFLICAIHAATEPGTAAFATSLAAADPIHRGLYIFHGPRVTSTEFRERLFDQIVKSYDVVVSIHGMLNTRVPVFVGGRNRTLVQKLRRHLGIPEAPPTHLSGCNPNNIVNRGMSGRGLQLELAPPALYKESPLCAWLILSTHRVLADSC
jgi:phage replication-related protein YjqB (UPF0714/DUF867 family)